MSFIAKYRSDCGNCDQPIEPGDEVDWLRVPDDKDVVVRIKCPETPLERPPDAVCSRCFCFHAGDCL